MAILFNVRTNNSLLAMFAMNSLLSTLVVFMIITLRERFEKYELENKKLKRVSHARDTFILLFITFCGYMLSYGILYFLFGYK